MNASSRCTLSLPIFIPGLLFILALLAICSLAPEAAARFFGSGQSWIAQHFSWFYVLVVGMFLILLLVIAFSHFGNIRLGPDDARPEFSFTSWLAMLFAAGMGIGLMYSGGRAHEPLRLKPQATPLTQVAAREAMVTTFFHWGFHAWAIYAIVGLVLAYFFATTCPDHPLRPLSHLLGRSTGLRPRVDIFALVGTIFGIATTLGYGVMQLGGDHPPHRHGHLGGAVSLRPHRGRASPWPASRRSPVSTRGEGLSDSTSARHRAPLSCWARPSTCWEPLGEHWQLCLLKPAHLPHLHLQRDPPGGLVRQLDPALLGLVDLPGPPSSASSSPASPADAPCANSSSASCSCPPPSTCSG
jgi:choline/glycine/proline betaine transport protein